MSLTARTIAATCTLAMAMACTKPGGGARTAPADTDSVPAPLPALPDDAGPEPCEAGALGPSFSGLPSHAGATACVQLVLANADPTRQDVAVLFGDAPAQIEAYEPSTRTLTVMVPVDAESGPVTLAVNCAEFTGPDFVVDDMPVPLVYAASPSSATAGHTVTVTGANFGGATEVDFGGAAQAFEIVDDSTLLTLPVQPATGAIVVHGPSGASCPGDAGVTVTP